MVGGLKLILLAALAACSVGADLGQSESVDSRANPIRRVVTMLQMMAKKVAEEGKKEDELYEKFHCYCETSGSDLQKSIGDGETRVPQLESDIKEAEGAKAQLEQELADHRKDRADAKAAIEKATGIREKEHAEFLKEEAEASSNIKALKAALAAIEKGMAGSFLQTETAAKLRKLVVSLQLNDMTDFDRRMVTEFLSTDSKQEYAPKSGEIVGILKQMGDEMDKDYMDLTKQEEEAQKVYNELVTAKEKEIAEATKAIETKTVRVGELSVEIVQMRNDLGETAEALMDDKKFLADLEKNCEQKKKEQAERQKTRAEEILALQETIKILNDDDALELFKKAIPSAALIQVRNEKVVRHQALNLVKQVRRTMRGGHTQLDLISMMLAGKRVNFEKVIKLIDEMVVTLKEEQTDDDDKKEYCEIQLDHAEDSIKETKRSISDLETKIADTEEGISTLVEDLKALRDGIVALDRSVVEATEQRKAENAEFTELMANDSTAKELIDFAKNRMNKFYNPKLYKPPPKRELTEEERITLNMGGTLEPTPPPGGIAGTGIGFVQLHSQVVRGGEDAAPPPPPETPGEYKKKGEESNGVIGMMDMLIGDLDKEMTEAKTEEKNAQEEYEEMMADAKAKRAEDSKAITEKEAAKASLETDLQVAKDSKTAETKELVATEEYMANLHGECDWLLENYDLRKQARAEETDALKKAKAVLSGADFSLVQTESNARRLRR